MAIAEKHTILIVDDDEQVLKLMERQLAETPHRIVPTSSPAEAIHILKSREVSVLICDLNMPDINGNAVLNTARDCSANIVSIVMSGGTDHSATIRAINEGGVWKFLTKPWEYTELLELINTGTMHYETRCHQQQQLEQLAQHVKEDTQHLEYDLCEEIYGSDQEVTPGGKPETTLKRKQIRVTKKGAPISKATEESTPPDNKKVFRIVKKKVAKTIKKEMAETSLFDTGDLSPRPSSDIIEDDRYRISKTLGQGTFGIVYVAEDRLLDIPVAVKILDPFFSSDIDLTDLLHNNTRRAMQLSHKHIVRLHNFQPVEEYFFLVMEFVKGRNLRDILTLYDRLPLDTTLQILKVCADALSYAHRHDVVHDDLKPTNLMLTDDGVLKIVGFGMAGVASLLHHNGKQIRGRDLLYMSPEQIQGQSSDHRNDIYSLSVIIYELLTGALPFPEKSPTIETVLKGHTELTGVIPAIADALDKGMAILPDDRWDSVEQFFDAIMKAAVA